MFLGKEYRRIYKRIGIVAIVLLLKTKEHVFWRMCLLYVSNYDYNEVFYVCLTFSVWLLNTIIIMTQMTPNS